MQIRLSRLVPSERYERCSNFSRHSETHQCRSSHSRLHAQRRVSADKAQHSESADPALSFVHIEVAFLGEFKRDEFLTRIEPASNNRHRVGGERPSCISLHSVSLRTRLSRKV